MSILSMQAPGGVLTSSRLRRVTDPISATPTSDVRLRHFSEGIYDLSPESHLVRFIKALTGDAGVGHFQRVYLHARTRNVLSTMRFADLDAFYGDVLGLKRMSWERTDPARYLTANTPSEWDEIDAKDSAYRARIEAFSRAIGLGGTPSGIMGIASALLGVEVRLYESYLIIDQSGQQQEINEPLQPRTYAEVQAAFPRYSDLNRHTYSDIEGNYGQIGRANVNDRTHFTLRPMRTISSEEEHQLRRVITRFRPTATTFTIDSKGVALHSPITLRGTSADSVHWQVITTVQPVAEDVRIYDPETPNVPHDGSAKFEAVRAAYYNRQGEVWSYNSDVVRSTSYREMPEAFWPDLDDPDDYDQRLGGVPERWRREHMTPPLRVNFQRVQYPTDTREYRPELSLASQTAILRGRMVSDGAAAASPVVTGPRISDGIVSVVEPVVGRIGQRPTLTTGDRMAMIDYV